MKVQSHKKLAFVSKVMVYKNAVKYSDLICHTIKIIWLGWAGLGWAGVIYGCVFLTTNMSLDPVKVCCGSLKC